MYDIEISSQEYGINNYSIESAVLWPDKYLRRLCVTIELELGTCNYMRNDWINALRFYITSLFICTKSMLIFSSCSSFTTEPIYYIAF